MKTSKWATLAHIALHAKPERKRNKMNTIVWIGDPPLGGVARVAHRNTQGLKGELATRPVAFVRLCVAPPSIHLWF